MPEHDIHDFLKSAQTDIRNEYERIQRRSKEDPGTAGDQGEENWAQLLRNWLPSYLQVVTKGRILTASGYASPQIDVLVLHPSYPKVLLNKKLYLAGGVAAAFECKTTLKSAHVKKAVKTAADIRKNLPVQPGSPFRELNSSIVYGLLAHSHSWQGNASNPRGNIENALWEADAEIVDHPIQSLDFLAVSDLAAWQARKMTYFSPKSSSFTPDMEKIYGRDGSATSSYVCAAIGAASQREHFSPIGALLAGLFSRLAWTFRDMRGMEAYFRQVNMMGSGQGKVRRWPLDIYSEPIRQRVYNGQMSNGVPFDEWHIGF